MKSLRYSSVCLLIIILPFFSVAAQSPSAAITGLVDDPARAVVVGAKVTAINTDTGARTSVETNSEGIYAISGLIPGPYRVEVEAIGFKTIVHGGLILHVQDSAQINFHLDIGSTTESISVLADAITVETKDASVSGCATNL